jgi:hypothetical protein
MESEVQVHDPAYIVRRRLGKNLHSPGDDRKEKIAEVEQYGSNVDENVMEDIITDYQQELGDSMRGLQGGGMPGKAGMMGDMREEDDMDEEEINEKIQKVMRVSSLKLAYQNYPVFKSIVVN